jgi:hypothetical protein
MSETEEDLHATSDAILADLQRLAALEEEKRPIDPADPPLAEVSARVADLAGRIRRESVAERELSIELKREAVGE